MNVIVDNNTHLYYLCSRLEISDDDWSDDGKGFEVITCGTWVPRQRRLSQK